MQQTPCPCRSRNEHAGTGVPKLQMFQNPGERIDLKMFATSPCALMWCLVPTKRSPSDDAVRCQYRAPLRLATQPFPLLPCPCCNRISIPAAGALTGHDHTNGIPSISHQSNHDILTTALTRSVRTLTRSSPSPPGTPHDRLWIRGSGCGPCPEGPSPERVGVRVRRVEVKMRVLQCNKSVMGEWTGSGTQGGLRIKCKCT